MSKAPGVPCWIDLLSSDIDRSRDFYTRLFGWSAGDASAEFGGYLMFEREGHSVAGAMPLLPEMSGASDRWTVYLAVADAVRTVETAQSGGATVAQPAYDVADLGSTALLVDPSGAAVGIWQTNTFAGFGTPGPGTPPDAPAYFELHTRDYDAAVSFYRDVLGWDAHERSEVPGLRYTTLGGGDAAAGIMDASEFMDADDSPAWQVYFATGDVDATLERATELGAAVLYPAMDTPFGRQATLTDPTGARFKLLGPATA
jgi:predicted enzyme related to lactoylglutathione lyase